MTIDLNKPILVTGASGRTGKRIVTGLGGQARVRAFVRRPEARDELTTMGVAEVIVGDLFDEAALAGAVAGAGQVLHICPPMHPQEDELARRITDLCIDNGVARVVLYSVLHPHIDVPHHRRKLAAEGYLIESGLPYTILQSCRYMAHVIPIWKAIVASGVHEMPFGVDARFSLIDLADIAEAAQIVLTSPGHDFATYELAGPEALSQTDCAVIISALIGRPVQAKAKPLDQFRTEALAAGMPAARVETMCIMNRHYDAHGLVGNPNVLRWLLRREPTNFRAFLQREMIAAR